jgi:hypothetical protein
LVDESSRKLSQKKKPYVNTIKVILVPSPPLTPKKEKKKKIKE